MARGGAIAAAISIYSCRLFGMLKINIDHISRHRHEKISGSDKFRHKYELVEAETARVIGDILTAQDYYARAISGTQ